MSKPVLSAHAIGSNAEATLPQFGSGSELASAKYLYIVRNDDTTKAGVFAVVSIPREGATDDIHLQPGQLGLVYNQLVGVTATPTTRWAYRRAQLLTPNGLLVLAVLCVALLAAWIDGTLALGKLPGWTWMQFQASTLATMAAVSMACKLASPVLAFLLALWFKK